MSTLNIGEKILKYRKEKNITQEQLANAIGVSAGAVCKWETGNSVPDISLLAPLARVLGSTIDDLLSFIPELSEGEVRDIKQELAAVFINSGYEAGEEQCRKLLSEYPNSSLLKLSIGGLLQVYAMMYEKTEDMLAKRLQHALALFQEVIEDGEIKYASQALFAAASLHMMMGNYEESEKAVKQLSDGYTDPMILYPQLLQRQGKGKEAKMLCENVLLSRMNHCMAMLSIMATIALEEENQEEALLLINSVIKTQDIYRIGLHSGEYSLCRYYIRTNQPELAAKAFKAYVEGILSDGYDYGDNLFFKDIELEVNAAGQKAVRRNMYQAQLDSQEFKSLEGMEEYDSAIELLKAELL